MDGVEELPGQPPAVLASAKGMVVTVAGHPSQDVPIGTLKAILKSAGLEPKKG